MSIRPHPTHAGWYVVDHYPNGRRGKREREPFPSYEQAVTFEQSLKKNAASPIKAVFPRFDDVIDEYLKYAKSRYSVNTYPAKERRLVNYIMPVFGKFRVRDLNQRMLDAYENSLNGKKWMFASDSDHLFAMVRWMIKRGYAEKLTWDPERVKGEHAVKQVPHPADLLKAIESIPKLLHRVLFKLMLFTGLRWNEARHIRWENVNTRANTIFIKEVVDAEQDVIYIPEPLQEWFRDNAKTEGWVFESHKCKGKPVKNLWKILDDASSVCGVHLSTHSLRHASATYLYEQSGDIYQVQAHLRHKKIATSMIYTRMSVAKKKSAVTSVIDYVVNAD